MGSFFILKGSFFILKRLNLLRDHLFTSPFTNKKGGPFEIREPKTERRAWEHETRVLPPQTGRGQLEESGVVPKPEPNASCRPNGVVVNFLRTSY